MEKLMDTIDFWLFPEEKRISVFNEIHDKKNINPKAAEKDWWVCHVIHCLFELRCADALTLKGGTSLSKAWGITERFSEDVDVSIDKSFFGLEGDTRSARDRIRKLSRKYIRDEIARELRGTLITFGAKDCDVYYKERNDSDADPTVLLIPYYSLLPEDPYIKNTVKVEFSCRNPREPRMVRPVTPFVAEMSPMIDYPETAIPTVVPTRTFLEKVFLLHEEFQKDYPRHRRMSRHLYDLFRMDSMGYTDKVVGEAELYATLVRHRSIFNGIRGIDYRGHSPANLSILPPEDVLPLWEDYRFMQEQFIYGESPSFEDLMKTVRGIQDRLRGMDVQLNLD